MCSLAGGEKQVFLQFSFLMGFMSYLALRGERVPENALFPMLSTRMLVAMALAERCRRVGDGLATRRRLGEPSSKCRR